jgi:hypothetical protein
MGKFFSEGTEDVAGAAMTLGVTKNNSWDERGFNEFRFPTE